MTVTADATVPARNAADALATADELAVEFAAGAADRDRHRILPYDQVDRLRESGLLALTVPRFLGGADLAPAVVAEVIRRLATADPNIAQIPHSHFVYVNLLRLAGTVSQQRRWLGAVAAGRQIANAQSERGGATLTDIATVVRPGSDGLRIDGEKFYCTGSLFADILAILVRLEEPVGDLTPGEYIAFVSADTAGVEIIDDWDGLGQRTTGSGTVRLRGVPVAVEDLVPRAPAVTAPGYGAFAQLLHTAIDTGIARGALTAAADFVANRARPWFEAGVDAAVDDPLTVQRFGELAVEVAAAEATLAVAAEAVDAVLLGGRPAGEASLAVATAKVLADRAAVSVSSALFEVSGTRSAAADLNLSHFWRNARTHTLHDPVRWKIQHLGRHVLRGETPPPGALL